MPHFEDSVLLDEQVPLSKYWNYLSSSEKPQQHIAWSFGAALSVNSTLECFSTLVHWLFASVQAKFQRSRENSC
jgi:hypothetical protein